MLTKNLSFSSHKGVISGFGEHFIKNDLFPKEMGRDINRAFGKRQIGDYNYDFVLSKEEAEEILIQAREFIDSIIKYLHCCPTENELYDDKCINRFQHNKAVIPAKAGIYDVTCCRQNWIPANDMRE